MTPNEPGSAEFEARTHYERYGYESMPKPEAEPKRQIDFYERMGFRLILDRSSLVDNHVITMGEWEPEQVSFFTHLAEHYRGKPNNVFLDIGAYWGLYSLIFNRTGIFDQIFTFEADAHNFSQLQAQLFLNHAAHKIRAVNKAISSENHVMHVWDSTSHPDGNRAGVGMVYEGYKDATYPVDAVTIDSHLSLTDSNLAIKIDVEGHEQMVLPGMARTMRENRVILQIEIYEPQQAVTFPMLEGLGLRRFHQIEHDFYYTNIDGLTAN